MKTIERLKQLLATATGGTWHGEVDNPRTLGDITSDTGGVVANVIVCFDECEDEAVATTELIAATRNSLPALLAAVEAAEKLVALRRTDQSLDWLEKELETEAALDAALRALEGGE